jgi:hypothetical protein
MVIRIKVIVLFQQLPDSLQLYLNLLLKNFSAVGAIAKNIKRIAVK